MDLPAEIVALVREQGLTATVAALIFLGLYLWERRGRMQDRKDYDAALRQATVDNTETLRTVIPLVQKMTSTMDVALPVLMAKVSDR